MIKQKIALSLVSIISFIFNLKIIVQKCSLCGSANVFEHNMCYSCFGEWANQVAEEEKSIDFSYENTYI